MPRGSFDSFTLQYRDAQGQPQALPIDGGSRSVTVPGLSPSRRYRFHLYGLRGRKKIDHVSIDIITELGELSVSSVSPSSVQLHWSIPEGSFDSFTLQYRGCPGPAPGPAHRWRVPLGDSARAVPVPPLPLPPLRAEGPLPAKAVLEDLRVSSVTPSSVQLHWSVPEGSFDSFTLQYRDAQGQPQALPIDGGSRSVTVPGLSPSHRYRFHLYGLRGRKKIDHVSTEAVTGKGKVKRRGGSSGTRPAPPAPPLIFLSGDPARPLRVFCDMDTAGGRLVFQRRQDGGTDFWRGWDAYARGFGNVSGEFWLGNEALHALTAARPAELRVDLRSGAEAAFAQYRDFAVGGAAERYRLRVGAFRGTAGDALSYHSGSPFSTRDRDPRDPRGRRDPAYAGAWWYRNCHLANLNGRYGSTRDHQVRQMGRGRAGLGALGLKFWGFGWVWVILGPLVPQILGFWVGLGAFFSQNWGFWVVLGGFGCLFLSKFGILGPFVPQILGLWVPFVLQNLGFWGGFGWVWVPLSLKFWGFGCLFPSEFGILGPFFSQNLGFWVPLSLKFWGFGWVWLLFLRKFSGPFSRNVGILGGFGSPFATKFGIWGILGPFFPQNFWVLGGCGSAFPSKFGIWDFGSLFPSNFGILGDFG
uniref:Uncharacterized protein n=1 Tax=Geospiza parvula TaxID=87175 RepID=A0A8U8BSG9_GEOPR